MGNLTKEVLRYGTHYQEITQFYLPATPMFIHKWSEPYLPLLSQPQLVLPCLTVSVISCFKGQLQSIFFTFLEQPSYKKLICVTCL